MRVGVKCNRYCGVAQPFLDNLWMYTLLQHKRGMGMSSIMEADHFNTNSGCQYRPCSADSVRPQGATLKGAEY